MDEQQPRQEWPTHCRTCGTALESGVVDVVPDADSEHQQTASPATVIAQDFCPNPDCRSNTADLGQVAREDRPGTEGGDNGGG